MLSEGKISLCDYWYIFQSLDRNFLQILLLKFLFHCCLLVFNMYFFLKQIISLIYIHTYIKCSLTVIHGFTKMYNFNCLMRICFIVTMFMFLSWSEVIPLQCFKLICILYMNSLVILNGFHHFTSHVYVFF